MPSENQIRLTPFSYTKPRDAIVSYVSQSLDLARKAMPCSVCFASGHVHRAGIDIAQPFTIGSKYRPGGTAVLSINPSASKGGGYKKIRLQALTRFSAGDNDALLEYWDELALDAQNLWNPRYLARLGKLNLKVDGIAVGNIALCATEHNKYPKWMLQQCWTTHSSKMLEALQPGMVVLMGSAGVMSSFELALKQSGVGPRVTRMAHFAHRKGNAFEANECERVKAFLSAAL